MGLGIVVTVVGGLILWGITCYYDQPTPSPPLPLRTKLPGPIVPIVKTLPAPSIHIEQHGNDNVTINGSITQGPCSVLQNGGNYN